MPTQSEDIAYLEQLRLRLGRLREIVPSQRTISQWNELRALSHENDRIVVKLRQKDVYGPWALLTVKPKTWRG